MISTIFNEGEHTCFASDSKGTTVLPIERWDPSVHAFFSINPLRPDGDSQPTQSYHRSDRPRRADCNVVSFRNILIEMDHIPLEEQMAIIQQRLQGCFTAITFSGKKSYHVIISLVEDLPDRAAYDRLALRLYCLFEGCADPACKNPSRLSRCPGHFRQDTNSLQNLISLRERVQRDDLENVLQAAGIVEVPHSNAVKRKKNSRSDRQIQLSHDESPISTDSFSLRVMRLPTFVHKFLTDGAPEGYWNGTLFRASCCAARSGIDVRDWIHLVKNINGYLDNSDVSTISSAYSRCLSPA